MRVWSRKQLELVELATDPAPYILASGATGSGKTSVCLIGFMAWSAQFTGRIFGLFAKTVRQAREVIMPALAEWLRELGVDVEIGLTQNRFDLFGNTYVLFSGYDVRTSATIQGFNLAGGYIDEVVNLSADVLMEVANRIRSVEGAKMVMTCNPKYLNHFFYRDYIKRADKIGMRIHHLHNSDNPAMPDDIRRNIYNTSIGADRLRRFDGVWATKSGLVYHDYAEPAPCPDWGESLGWYLTVDPGDANSTHALLIGQFEGVWWVCEEWRMDWSVLGYQMSHDKQAAHIAAWLRGHGVELRGGVVDAASQSMRVALMNELSVPIYNSKKDVGKGNANLSVEFLQIMLSTGVVRLSDRLPRLMDEIMLYQYDAGKGDDTPEKSALVHGLDALRYFAYTMGRPVYDRPRLAGAERPDWLHQLRNFSAYQSLDVGLGISA